jgi:hypothetical protein
MTLAELLQGRESSNVEDLRKGPLTPPMTDAQWMEYLRPYRQVPTNKQRADYRLPPDLETLGEISGTYMAPWLLRQN